MALISSSAMRWLTSIFIVFWISKSNAQNQVFDIMQFGGQSDGSTDNSLALSKAWWRACECMKGSAVVLIPRGTFLVSPVVLQGPCKGSIQLQIDGQVLAPKDHSFTKADHWLAIRGVNNLVVHGEGYLDGQGSSAWPFSGCRTHGICSGLPMSLKFSSINNATIRNIKSLNSKFFHLSVFKSQNVTFDNVTLVAPEDSPNTDGIHISMSTNINVMNSVIKTGDDCISLGPGSNAINITNIQCGPGHGISIGSLGQNLNELDVTNIIVRDSIFNNTQNGVRIKSWSTPFSSRVSKIAFINLQMNNVKHPIIIDQNYCPHRSCYPGQMSTSRVQIQDVRYEDIRGTSSGTMAVNFDCSQVVPCKGIVLQDINMTLNDGGIVTSRCNNVKGSAFGLQLPPSCL